MFQRKGAIRSSLSKSKWNYFEVRLSRKILDLLKFWNFWVDLTIRLKIIFDFQNLHLFPWTLTFQSLSITEVMMLRSIEQTLIEVRNDYQKWKKLLDSHSTATQAEEFRKLTEKLKQDIEGIFDDLQDLEETIRISLFFDEFFVLFDLLWFVFLTRRKTSLNRNQIDFKLTNKKLRIGRSLWQRQKKNYKKSKTNSTVKIPNSTFNSTNEVYKTKKKFFSFE